MIGYFHNSDDMMINLDKVIKIEKETNISGGYLKFYFSKKEIETIKYEEISDLNAAYVMVATFIKKKVK